MQFKVFCKQKIFSVDVVLGKLQRLGSITADFLW